MSDQENSSRTGQLSSLSPRYASDDDAHWVSHTAVELASEPDSEWLQFPAECRQNFVMVLTNPDLAHPDVDIFPFLARAAVDPDAEVRAFVIETLADEFTDQSLPLLLDLLAQSPDSEIRASVALGVHELSRRAAAGELAPEQAQALYAALLSASRSEPVLVRQRALETLAYFSPDPVVETAIATAYESGDLDLKGSALFAMGRYRIPRWFPILYEELLSPDPGIRYEAARSIGDYADQRALDRLIPLIEDEDRQVQGAASGAIGDIGGETAVAVLQRVAQGGDIFLRQSAEYKLNHIREHS